MPAIEIAMVAVWTHCAELVNAVKPNFAPEQTLQVSSGQIGGREPKDAKCMVCHTLQVGGLGETENFLETPGGKFWLRT